MGRRRAAPPGRAAPSADPTSPAASSLILADTSARARSMSGRSKRLYRAPRARLVIDGYRRRVDSITRSSVSRSPSDGSGPSRRATTMASCSLRRCWAMKMRRNASVSAVARRQVGHPVVGQRPQQPVAEPRRQALALGVEGSQVGVQVLGGRSGVGVSVHVAALRGERAEVGEGVEDPQHIDDPTGRGRPGVAGPRRSRRRSRARTRGRARSCRRRGRSPRRAARSMRSLASLSAPPSPSGSIRNSGVPAATCTFVVTKTSRTRPPSGEEMAISIFIASTTARRVPASTMSSGATSTPTTSAAAGARMMPASSREKR